MQHDHTNQLPHSDPNEFRRNKDFWVGENIIIPEKAKLIRDKRNQTLA